MIANEKKKEEKNVFNKTTLLVCVGKGIS